MRKSLLSILFIVPFFVSNAQKIAESKIDDFTGKQVIYTSWTPFFEGEDVSGQMASEVRFRYEHDRDFMQIKVLTGDAELTCKEGVNIDFKTDKGVFSFPNQRTEKSGRGKGLEGGKSAQLGLTIQVTGDFIDFLDSRVEKVRLRFEEGYYDIEVPVKYQKVFRNSFELIVKEVIE